MHETMASGEGASREIELDLLREDVNRRRIENMRLEVEARNAQMTFLREVREEMEALGDLEPRDRLHFKDSLRNLSTMRLACAGPLPLPENNSEETDRDSEITILGVAQEHFGTRYGETELQRISHIAAYMYNKEHNGKNPAKRDVYVDGGAMRRVTCYYGRDRDLIVRAIEAYKEEHDDDLQDLGDTWVARRVP